MKLELQKTLFETYPRFFRRPRQERYYTVLDFWGIECGDGWYQPVADVAACFERHIEMLIAAGISKRAWPRAVQVKEKFGELNVYVRPARNLPDTVRQSLAAAERLASHTCERCGQPGTLKTDRWLRVSCPVCEAAKREDELFDVTVLERDRARLRQLLCARSV